MLKMLAEKNSIAYLCFMAQKPDKPKRPSVSKAQRLLHGLSVRDRLAVFAAEPVHSEANCLTFQFGGVFQTVRLSDPQRFDRQKLWHFRVETEMFSPLSPQIKTNFLDLANFSSNLAIGSLVPSSLKKGDWAICSMIPYATDFDEIVSFTLEQVILAHWMWALNPEHWPREITEFFDPHFAADPERQNSFDAFRVAIGKALCHPKSSRNELMPDRASVRQQVCKPPFVVGQWHDSQVWGMVPWGAEFAHLRYDNDAYHPLFLSGALQRMLLPLDKSPNVLAMHALALNIYEAEADGLPQIPTPVRLFRYPKQYRPPYQSLGSWGVHLTPELTGLLHTQFQPHILCRNPLTQRAFVDSVVRSEWAHRIVFQKQADWTLGHLSACREKLSREFSNQPELDAEEIERKLDVGSYRPSSVLPPLLRRRRGFFKEPYAVPAEWLDKQEAKGLFTFGYFNPNNVQVCMASYYGCPTSSSNSLLGIRFWGPTTDIALIIGRWENSELADDTYAHDLFTRLFTREQLSTYANFPQCLPTWVYAGNDFSPGWEMAYRAFMEQARFAQWDPRPLIRSIAKFHGRPWERWFAQQDQQAWNQGEIAVEQPMSVVTDNWRSSWMQEWWNCIRKPEHREAEVHATWTAWQRQFDLLNPVQLSEQDQMVDPGYAAEILSQLDLSPF